MEQPPPAPPDEARPRPWRLRLSWPVVLLLAWLVYEFTALPGLAAAVTCWKFGWADFLAARWLRRAEKAFGQPMYCTSTSDSHGT